MGNKDVQIQWTRTSLTRNYRAIIVSYLCSGWLIFTLSRTSTLRWSIRSIHWSMMFPWKPSLIQNLFRHKFSLLVVEPSQSGKKTSYDRSTNCDLFYGISGTRAAKRAVRTEPHTHIGKQKKHMNCFSQGYHGETMSLIITKRLMRTEFIVSSCLENLALFLWKLFRFLV